jgi:Arc/MetJ-type ribon-helix-helix transcriptional regulator
LEVSLTPEHEEFIARSVESGEYPSAADALNDAVEELRRRHDYRAYVRKAVAESVAARERGEGTVYQDGGPGDLAREIKAEARARYVEQLREAA